MKKSIMVFITALLFILPPVVHGAYVIRLKSGAAFKVKDFWMEGGKVKFMYYSGVVSVKEADLKDIEHYFDERWDKPEEPEEPETPATEETDPLAIEKPLPIPVKPPWDTLESPQPIEPIEAGKPNETDEIAVPKLLEPPSPAKLITKEEKEFFNQYKAIKNRVETASGLSKQELKKLLIDIIKIRRKALKSDLRFTHRDELKELQKMGKGIKRLSQQAG